MVCSSGYAALGLFTHEGGKMWRSSRIRVVAVLAVVLSIGTTSTLLADQAADEAAIRNNADDYVAAYNKHDAGALASFWSPEAVYENPLTGEEVVGRKAIAEQFTAILRDLGEAKLSVDVKSVKFLSPNIAVEEGTARVVGPDADVEETDYTAFHVRRDGKWLLDRVSEESAPVVVSNYDRLKDLEWMIGDWVDGDDRGRVEMTCKWTKNQSFITRSFAVSIRDRIDMSGIQIIGWDASAGKIRSWVFDSDGGFGEATWTRKDKRWIIHAAATLPDGRKTSAINILTLLDNNSFTWQSTGRELDGEILPNIEPVKVVRGETTRPDSNPNAGNLP
jgi:uncharacterized protein (TIGR02246 family)